LNELAFFKIKVKGKNMSIEPKTEDPAQSACNGGLCVGDEVTWTHVHRYSRGSVSLTTRRAKIIHLTGHNVAVKFKGQLINLRPDAVRKSGG
jgi:hypothetical protein